MLRPKNVKLSTEALQASTMTMMPARTLLPSSKSALHSLKVRTASAAPRGNWPRNSNKNSGAPSLTKRFGEQEPPKPKPKRTSRSLDQASTDELLAELAKRSDDDDLAFAATRGRRSSRGRSWKRKMMRTRTRRTTRVLCPCIGRTGNLPSAS